MPDARYFAIVALPIVHTQNAHMKKRPLASLLALFIAVANAPVAADTLYNKGGLIVEADTRSQRDVNTGQAQHLSRTTITFQGHPLCGTDVATLLYPDRDGAAPRAFFCSGPVEVLDAGILAFFTSSSANTVLAHLAVREGALRVQRIDVSDQPSRNTLYGTRFMDARLPGWTRIETAWKETVLIRHADARAINLGEGRLLDIDGDIAYLAIPPGSTVIERQPETRIKDAYGDMQRVPAVTEHVPTALAFRAVRLTDGHELARLTGADRCLLLPRIEFEPNAYAAGSKIDVAYDDVPAWRASTLQFNPGKRSATLQLRPGIQLPRKPGCTPG